MTVGDDHILHSTFYTQLLYYDYDYDYGDDYDEDYDDDYGYDYDYGC